MKFHKVHNAPMALQITGMKSTWLLLRNDYLLPPKAQLAKAETLSGSLTETFFSLQTKQKLKKTPGKLARGPGCPTQWYPRRLWFCRLAKEHNIIPRAPPNLSAAGTSQLCPPQDTGSVTLGKPSRLLTKTLWQNMQCSPNVTQEAPETRFQSLSEVIK